MGWTPGASFHHPRKIVTWQSTKIHPKKPEISSLLCFKENSSSLIKRWTRTANLHEGNEVLVTVWNERITSSSMLWEGFSPFCFSLLPLLVLNNLTDLSRFTSTFSSLVPFQATADPSVWLPCGGRGVVVCPGLAKSVGARSFQGWDLLRKCPDRNFAIL